MQVGSVISVPGALTGVWAGCGGGGSASAAAPGVKALVGCWHTPDRRLFRARQLVSKYGLYPHGAFALLHMPHAKT